MWSFFYTPSYLLFDVGKHSPGKLILFKTKQFYILKVDPALDLGDSLG